MFGHISEIRSIIICKCAYSHYLIIYCLKCYYIDSTGLKKKLVKGVR